MRYNHAETRIDFLWIMRHKRQPKRFVAQERSAIVAQMGDLCPERSSRACGIVISLKYYLTYAPQSLLRGFVAQLGEYLKRAGARVTGIVSCATNAGSADFVAHCGALWRRDRFPISRPLRHTARWGGRSGAVLGGWRHG